MYASTLPRSNWLRRASIRLAWYRHMPASSYSFILYHFRVFWRWIIRDLEICITGHSMSLKLVPLESMGVVSYSPSIINMADAFLWDIATCSSKIEQELSYRKQIASQLRTQYVEGISDNPVTLKSRLTVTQGHWKRNYWVDHTRLTYVEYYRDLEMWVRGHSKSLKLVPFESLGAVSYSPSIVTVAESVAVCEIFNVKEWRHLKNQVRGRSRSLKMAPFDRPYTTFYWSAIVNIALSCTIFELFDVE